MTYATRQVFLRTGFQVTGTQSLACRSHVRTLVKMVNLKRISFNIYTPQADVVPRLSGRSSACPTTTSRDKAAQRSLQLNLEFKQIHGQERMSS